MNNKHKLFIDLYCNPQSTNTFLNASQSYALAYKKATDPHANAYRLTEKAEIKKEIEGRLKVLANITMEEYTGLLNKEYLNLSNNSSTRLRALELLGKAKGYLSSDTQVNNTVNTIDIKAIRAEDRLERCNGVASNNVTLSDSIT